MNPLTAAAVKKIILTTLKDHKAIDISSLDIKKLTDIADYMIICTANSTTHVKALVEKIIERLKNEHIRLMGVEGENTREWMLIDFGNVIVHIMLAPIREFYSLEKLWGINKITKSRSRQLKSSKQNEN